MADVAGILLVQVGQDVAQVGRLPVASHGLRRLVEPAVREHRRDRSVRPFHRIAPQREELVGGVVGRRPPLPLGFGGEVDRVPRSDDGLSGQVGGGVVVLDEREVLHQAAEGHRGRRVRSAEPGRVQPAAHPGERGSRAVEGEEERLDLPCGPRQRGDPGN